MSLSSSGAAYGHREFFRLGGIRLCHLGSWDRPFYSRLGAWRSGLGVMLRYRGWLLRLALR